MTAIDADGCVQEAVYLNVMGDNMRMAASRWCYKYGFVSSVWNGEQAQDVRQLICFRDGFAKRVNVQIAVLKEIWPQDYSSRIAANRWADANGYGTGFFDGEAIPEHLEVTAVFKSAGNYCDVRQQDLDVYFPDNKTIAAHRWRNGQGHAADIWNHEQSGDIRGVWCFDDIAVAVRNAPYAA